MEMPDPITRTVWGNYLAVPVKWEAPRKFVAFKDLNEEEYRGKADKVDIDSIWTKRRNGCNSFRLR